MKTRQTIIIGSCALAMLLMGGIAARAESVTDKRALTIEGAKKVIAGAVAEAKKKNAPGGVVAVVDDGGNLMALERIDNTFAAGANISIGKARTAALFKKPTKVFEDIVNKGRTTMVALNDFTPLQGGIPIEWKGKIVGAVGVSGAASAQQDEELAIAGAKALESMEMAGMSDGHSPLPVTYIESQKVMASFQKGAVLVGEDETMMHAARNYMVHASHRDKAGVVEIHEYDTDIVYVLKGSATLITGGTPEGTKMITPHEFRAPTVNGGETRTLVPGDVVIIPNGVPHWFKEVEAPFDYYVVKVR
ncbi:MAG TPA: heme-binding protein [Nitrospiraceae bacterium]|jgi:glc operon protein GlcG|nr:heme-binding protein [Nitrospiraceae bacterium]